MTRAAASDCAAASLEEGLSLILKRNARNFRAFFAFEDAATHARKQ